MSIYDKDGHLFGDAVFRVKYRELQNENEEMQIRYSEEKGLEINGVGGGGDVVKIVYDDATMSAEDLGVAVKAVCDAGKIPAVARSGVFYCSQSVTNEEGYFEAVLGNWGFNVTDGDLVSIGVEVMILQYTENDGWTLQNAFNEITGR